MVLASQRYDDILLRYSCVFKQYCISDVTEVNQGTSETFSQFGCAFWVTFDDANRLTLGQQ